MPRCYAKGFVERRERWLQNTLLVAYERGGYVWMPEGYPVVSVREAVDQGYMRIETGTRKTPHGNTNLVDRIYPLTDRGIAFVKAALQC